jgi:RNA polymerase sigma-70 factor (ECF subfamily)
LQASPLLSFSLQKFLNKTGCQVVFMFGGKRVVTGEAILNGVTTSDRNAERDRVQRTEQTLEALVREHSRLVYRIAYAVLRRHHDAEDATQETFMRVLRYSSKLAEIENPKTWLARIAWRVAVDRIRHVGSHREVPLDDPENPGAEIASSAIPADETAHEAQASAVLEKLIATLPTKLREPLILSTIQEMSPREVAASLGINEATVRSRVFRARHILKEKLAQRMRRK